MLSFPALSFCCNLDLKRTKNSNKAFIFDEVDWIIFITKTNGDDQMVHHDLCSKERETLMHIVLVTIFLKLMIHKKRKKLVFIQQILTSINLHSLQVYY